MFKWRRLLIGIIRCGMLLRERIYRERRDWDVLKGKEASVEGLRIVRIGSKPEILVTLH